MKNDKFQSRLGSHDGNLCSLTSQVNKQYTTSLEWCIMGKKKSEVVPFFHPEIQ